MKKAFNMQSPQKVKLTQGEGLAENKIEIRTLFRTQFEKVQYNNLYIGLKRILYMFADNCLLLTELRHTYLRIIQKTFPLQDNQVRIVFKKHFKDIKIIGKEESALAIYVDPENIPDHLLMIHCLNFLYDCNSFIAAPHIIAQSLQVQLQLVVEPSRIVQLAKNNKDFFENGQSGQHSGKIKLTIKARIIMLRKVIIMLLKTKRVSLSSISNILNRPFSLSYYGRESMSALFDSFGPNLVKINSKGKNREKRVELSSLGKFYVEMRTLLEKNAGAISVQVLKKKYIEMFHKELVFCQHGFSKVEEFAAMFPTSFKIYGENNNKTVVLVRTTTNWMVTTEPKLENIVALDCEMVAISAGNGYEVSRAARCSIVDHNLEILYNKHFKPEEAIIDYRTKYSGITRQHLQAKGTISFNVARNEILDVLKNKVVVGHSLENDFKSLKLKWPETNRRDLAYCHLLSDSVVGLKKLTFQYLNKTIQTGSHCCLEDARASMELYKLVHKEWEK